MTKTAEKQLPRFTREEWKKFVDKTEEAWFWYMSDFRTWRRQVGEVKQKYNGFGMDIPYTCVKLETLFENFIRIEAKKTKNRKYRWFLLRLLDAEEPYIDTREKPLEQ
ncbi:MAG: hypothetical protein MdMp014T_1098 [Treponematales bacterium]